MAAHSASIRLGIDLGNTGIRVAYVYPDGERVVVTVPVSLGARLPICEQMPINDPYLPPFSPGLLQRLEPGFGIRIGHELHTTARLVTNWLKRTVEIARDFSGAEVDGIMMTLPTWQVPETRELLRAAILDAGVNRAFLAAHSDAAAAYVRSELMGERRHETTLLFSAGYAGIEIAVIRLTQKGHRVLVEASNQSVLAGNCLDFAITNAAMHQLKANGILVSGVREATSASVEIWTEVQLHVETAKHELDEQQEAFFSIPPALMPGATKDVTMRIDGTAFRRLVGRQMDKAGDMIGLLLREADIQATDIDHVILEGGGVHLPGVAKRLTEYLPRAQLRYLPSDALSSGAALLAMDADFHERFEPPLGGAIAHFVPQSVVESDLVTLESAVASAPVAITPRPPIIPPPEPPVRPPAEVPEQAIEDVTLTELRRLVPVAPDYVMRRLTELRDATTAQIDTLTRSATRDTNP